MPFNFISLERPLRVLIDLRVHHLSVAILLGLIICSPSEGNAVPAAPRPVSFATMERVSRKIQKPAVEAIANLHQEMGDRLQSAISAVQKIGSGRSQAVFQPIYPDYLAAKADFAESEFGSLFLRAQALTPQAVLSIQAPPDLDKRLWEGLKKVHSDLENKFGPNGTTDLSSLVAIADENVGKLEEAVNTSQLIGSKIAGLETLVSKLAGGVGLGGIASALNSLPRVPNISNLPQLNNLLSSLNQVQQSLGTATDLGSLAGVPTGNLGNQISSLSQSLGSLIGNLQSGIKNPIPPQFGQALEGVKGAVNSALSPIKDAIGTLKEVQFILKTVKIPFYETVKGVFSAFKVIASPTMLTGDILKKLGVGTKLIQIIQFLTTASGASALITAQFNQILGPLEAALDKFNGNLVNSINEIIKTPASIGDELLNQVESAANVAELSPLLQTTWAGQQQFQTAVEERVHEVVSGLPSIEPGAPVFALTASNSPRYIPSTARAALGSESELVFGRKNGRASSRNFCYSITSPRRKSKCVERANRDWIRFQAKLRSLSDSTVASLKSKKVVEKIEVKSFGRKLSSIISEAQQQAESVNSRR